jgi:hypothetical protein
VFNILNENSTFIFLDQSILKKSEYILVKQTHIFIVILLTVGKKIIALAGSTIVSVENTEFPIIQCNLLRKGYTYLENSALLHKK